MAPGAAFAVGGVSFAWKVVTDGPNARVEGLVATTSGSDTLGIVMLTFFKGDRLYGDLRRTDREADEEVTLERLVTDKTVVVDSLL